MISDQVFHIMEYQTIDSLGRGKEWLYAGIADSEDAVTVRFKSLTEEWAKKSKKIAFRSHRYSHAHGKNA
jgi:hypothetical protein